MRTHFSRLVIVAQEAVPLVLCLALAGCTAASTPVAPSPRATSATLTPTENPAAIIQRDIHTLRKESYSADYHTGARMPDGTVLLIFHSLCTGSTDGHCQAIDVFENARPRPLWHHAYAGVLSIHTLRNGFSVRAVNYAPHDPLCCPSLPPVTDSFTWTGSGFTEHGVPPASPGG